MSHHIISDCMKDVAVLQDSSKKESIACEDCRPVKGQAPTPHCYGDIVLVGDLQ